MLSPLPVWPFSIALALVGVPASTGASLRGATVVDSVCVADHWLAASPTAAPMSPAPAPTGASDTRTVKVPGVPL